MGVVRARSTSLRSPGLGSTISLAKAAGRFHAAPPDPLLAKLRQASVVDTAKGTANSQADEDSAPMEMRASERADEVASIDGLNR